MTFGEDLKQLLGAGVIRFFCKICENAPKTFFFRGVFGADFLVKRGCWAVIPAKKAGQEKFFRIGLQRVGEKMQKKCGGARRGNCQKRIFAAANREGQSGNAVRVRLATFIERMERCSKYSRKFFLRFASDKVGTDKK